MSNLTNRPFFKGKPHVMLVVTSWLAAAAAEYTGTSEYADTRSNCLWAFTMALEVLRQAPMFLEPRDCDCLEFCRHMSLTSYNYLSHHGATAHPRRYPTKPQFRMFDHCLRDCVSQRRNALTWWAFFDEDVVGKIARIARTSHQGVALERAVVQKLLLQRSDDTDKRSASRV